VLDVAVDATDSFLAAVCVGGAPGEEVSVNSGVRVYEVGARRGEGRRPGGGGGWGGGGGGGSSRTCMPNAVGGTWGWGGGRADGGGVWPHKTSPSHPPLPRPADDGSDGEDDDSSQSESDTDPDDDLDAMLASDSEAGGGEEEEGEEGAGEGEEVLGPNSRIGARPGPPQVEGGEGEWRGSTHAGWAMGRWSQAGGASSRCRQGC
jgi:hypothetical protein